MTEQDKIDALLERYKYDLPEQEYEDIKRLTSLYKLTYEDVEYEIENILNKLSLSVNGGDAPSTESHKVYNFEN